MRLFQVWNDRSRMRSVHLSVRGVMLLRHFCARENSIPICFPTPIEKLNGIGSIYIFLGLHLLRQRENGITRMHSTIYIYINAYIKICLVAPNRASIMELCGKNRIFWRKYIHLSDCNKILDLLFQKRLLRLHRSAFFGNQKKNCILETDKTVYDSRIFYGSPQLFMHLVGTVAICVAACDWHINAAIFTRLLKRIKRNSLISHIFLDSIILSFCKSKRINAHIGEAPYHCSQFESTLMNVSSQN